MDSVSTENRHRHRRRDGIGEAIAHKFAKEGAAVVVCGLPGDPIDDVVARIRSHGSKAVAYAGDVSEEAHAEAACRRRSTASGAWTS